MNDIQQTYEAWKENVSIDSGLFDELKEMENDKATVEDRFFSTLSFGTGGLRGVIGAGTNCMNVYTVGKATQGFALYLKRYKESPSVAIGYDSRHLSDVFAKTAAGVFAANGIRVHLYSHLMPTPALSFAVRQLSCDGGVVITASHNPAKYNGYKVYGADGCQITDEVAREISDEIVLIDPFKDVWRMSLEDGLSIGLIEYIPESVREMYLEAVSAQSVLKAPVDKSFPLVYTPLHGTGITCVPECLRLNGFNNINIPPSQHEPNGSFFTCPYPNPEEAEALQVGIMHVKQKVI